MSNNRCSGGCASSQQCAPCVSCSSHLENSSENSATSSQRTVGHKRSTGCKRPRPQHAADSSQQEDVGSSCSLSRGDLECAVCCELLLDPVVGPCGHDFCLSCYQRWQMVCSFRGMAVCPLCRTLLPPVLGVCLRLKKTVEALYPEACKRRRKEVELHMQELGNAEAAKQPDMPSYPQGPYPASLAMQWAAAQAQAFSSFYGQQQQQQLPGGAAQAPELFAQQQMFAMMAGMMASMAAMSSMQQQQRQQDCPIQLPPSAMWPQGGTLPDWPSGGIDVAAGMPVLCQVFGALCSNWPPWSQQLQQQQVPQVQQQGSDQSPASLIAEQPADTAASVFAPQGQATPPIIPQNEFSNAQQAIQQQQQQHATCRWQSDADLPQRLECARLIFQLLQGRGMQEVLGVKLIPAVRAVEVALYRSAASQQEYVDKTTLEARVVALVRHRAAMAAARRVRLASGAAAAAAGPQQVAA